MHADEYRDPAHTHHQIVKMEISDPYRLYEKYVGLSARAKNGTQPPRGDSDLDAEQRELKRRISSAHAALAGMKDENAELRKKLTALRESKTMRAGKLIAQPARAMEKAAKKVRSTDFSSARKKASSLKREFLSKKESGLNSAKEEDALRSVIKDSKIISPSSRMSAQVPARPKADLVLQFESEPNQKNFERALNSLWYQQGDISSAQALIENHPEWCKNAGDKFQMLLRRIEGSYRLQENGVALSSRSEGAAYITEPSRIMYCVHSTPVFNSNGYSTRTKGIAEGMSNAGGDVVVVARAGYPWDSKADIEKPEEKRYEASIGEVNYVHIPGPNLNQDSLDDYIMETADAFVREAKMLRPETIQSASNHRTALPALIAARRLGVPFVYEVRGFWEYSEVAAKPSLQDSERFHLQQDLETFVAKESDQVLAITAEVAKELEKRGVDRDKIMLAPNGVNPHDFVPLPRDDKYARAKKYDPEKLTIGFAGSFVGYEGLDVLLQASALLVDRGVDHQVVLAGSGSAEKDLIELKEQLGNSNVHFLGRLPQEHMYRLMSTFDIVACPRVSTKVTELVSPLKPLESFSSAKATVLSDVSPHLTLAGDSKKQPRALVAPAGDVDALADTLQRLLEDEDLRRSLGRTARLWAVEERSWTRIGSTVLESHKAAHDLYHSQITEGPLLKDLKVGVIADEFTRTTLQATFDVTLLDKDSWDEQIQQLDFDFIFVESAWNGNHGQWHRSIGYYGEKENAPLFGLLQACQKRGIPTVFWNKEDPVHFDRFSPIAAYFDHVFTTDANMIPRYRALEGNRNQTISSHSFYAQPMLHNPLPPARSFKPTVAYAGTYYGARYQDRTDRLNQLLEAAEAYGLDIYDRQAEEKNSPYKFPDRFQQWVRGALPYSEVIDSYKSHLAHINVNSVEFSPSMFSRRVVEIPASGGVLISAEGRGISESIGSVLATSNNSQVFKAWLHDWFENPSAWFNERWLQMRAVFRSHTSNTALTILARTVGFASKNPGLPSFAIEVENLDESAVEIILASSVRPTAIAAHSVDEIVMQRIEDAGILLAKNPADIDESISWITLYNPEADRTYYEDMLTATTYGEWEYIDTSLQSAVTHDLPLVAPTTSAPGPFALVRTDTRSDSLRNVRSGLTMVKSSSKRELHEYESVPPATLSRDRPKERILVAGHDLKFITSFIEHLESQGHVVETDVWESHTKHDASISAEKLARADVVIAEWGLGNAVWYSRHIAPHQRLIVRVHLQELFRPYLAKINHANVDKFVFVGELILQAAIQSHGVPAGKSLVISNAVDTQQLNRHKKPGTEKTMGLVGIIPQRKRLDLALDLLETLLESDESYKLRIKGKTPEEYPWMKNRPDELRYYEAQWDRIEKINQMSPGSVIVDGYGEDMAEWYRNVGIVLSTSDFESFHFTLPDGAASGARPLSLNWDGADAIYPTTWLYGTVSAMAQDILEDNWSEQDQEKVTSFVKSEFDKEVIFSRLKELISATKQS